MSKSLLLTLPGLVAVVSCSFLAKPSTAPKSNPNADIAGLTEGQATNLSRLYAEACAKCHGDKAQGGGGGTPSLLTREKFDQKNDRPFFLAIKNGVPNMGMEAYGQTLSDAEIWGLVVRIRELQGRGLREMEGGPKETDGVYTSKHHKYRLETVVEQGQGLKTPWSIDWLPSGEMLVTNRPGGIVLIKNGQVVSQIEGLPGVVELGQGGQMEVAVHPNYAQNGWIYLSYTDPSSGGQRGGMTKIVRGKLSRSGARTTWTGQQTIWETTPDNYTGSGVHFGSKIVFDGKGHVFFSVGERGDQNKAQDLNRPNGKVFRLNEDGSVPKDNPFIGTPGALPGIWSYGHRNPQGLAMDLSGNLFDTEHGPRGGDEVNRIQKGNNYGWPVVAFSINYNDSAFTTPWPKPEQKITLPIFRWLPSIGASGLDVVKGAAFPGWRGDLVAGGLAGNNLDRFRIKGDQLVEREELVFGKGRIREVATGPDGMIYLALNQPDKIVRLVPVK